ncbi:MAG: TlyA family RNA methyltransferase [Coriobacteriia bacterium]|nr:TlyA family RNA methyltransferase [Coriobacteriia bacterium]
MSKRRVDELLVSQGYFANTDAALRAIMAGEVSSHGRRLTSAGEKIPEDSEFHVKTKLAYVSRGGIKLKGALDTFRVSVQDAYCLDIGASSGGFTDCLLQEGARHVVSVDVGQAQFDWRLRNDERVTLLEKTNIVDVVPDQFEQAFDLIVCDVSFISLRYILEPVARLIAPHAYFLTLVKPQFEAAREEVGKNGVVLDRAVHEKVLESLVSMAHERGFSVEGLAPSLIRGAKGNREFFMLARLGEYSEKIDIQNVVDEAWNC